MDKLYVLSLNFQQARYWAWQAGLKKGDWQYVLDERLLLGRRDIDLACVGEWNQRNDIVQIAQTAHMIQARLVDIFTWAADRYESEAYLSQEGHERVREERWKTQPN